MNLLPSPAHKKDSLRMEHPPRIERLRIRNYRALRNVTVALKDFTVFVGANGSAKSTMLDVFSFIAECFSEDLPKAWDRRGRFRELRSRGVGDTDSISFELKYRESGDASGRAPLITYYLEISEEKGRPVVSHEYLQWKRKPYGAPFRFLEFKKGEGKAVSGDEPDDEAEKQPSKLARPELLAVNALGQFQDHPRVQALREFVTGWKLFYFSSEEQRGQPEVGPQEHLSKTGDNLANVVQFLQESHPNTLEQILRILQRRVPRLEKVEPKIMEDGRLLLRFKDQPFDEPVQARFISDGTLKMLAYLILLHDPDAPPLMGIEEPENFLHPKLLTRLAEECQDASGQSQFLTTTHSPEFLNAVAPESVRFLARNEEGYTEICTTADDERLCHFIREGGGIGDLWMEGHITHGDPNLFEAP